ncbi:MAG TPA: sugar phosphate nucleotidyltransferase [Steroidobacteraceae bacterium]|nr:sugar phosphate nucleotidyltransferase [Steroidobacteraceae bacterium]
MITHERPISPSRGPGPWTLVLAAGDGSRLNALTRGPSGECIPKQFCSLREGPSLLQQALGRAARVAVQERVCAVVAEKHRCWWRPSLQSLCRSNVIVQPRNCGTAIGLLLALLCIVERDPDASLVILPSDHHVGGEDLLTQALRNAIEQLTWRFDETMLLGFAPEQSDAELGYIVPGEIDGHGAWHVEQFIEKPPLSVARELIGRGALWNSFIVVAHAAALMSLYRRRIPHIVADMRTALQEDRAQQGSKALRELYERLPSLDFSRHILQGQQDRLRVLPVPHCGWSDLGTPSRVAEALGRAATPAGASKRSDPAPQGGYLNLAAQFEALRANPR